eukprot:7879747-Lingulodinium_polyedra.AAC.3
MGALFLGVPGVCWRRAWNTPATKAGRDHTKRSAKEGLSLHNCLALEPKLPRSLGPKWPATLASQSGQPQWPTTVARQNCQPTMGRKSCQAQWPANMAGHNGQPTWPAKWPCED